MKFIHVLEFKLPTPLSYDSKYIYKITTLSDTAIGTIAQFGWLRNWTDQHDKHHSVILSSSPQMSKSVQNIKAMQFVWWRKRNKP